MSLFGFLMKNLNRNFRIVDTNVSSVYQIGDFRCLRRPLGGVSEKPLGGVSEQPRGGALEQTLGGASEYPKCGASE